MKIPNFSNLMVRVARKFTLRTVLIVPFVLQIVGTVGLVGYLSYRNGREAVNDVVGQLQVEISDRVQLYLKTYLATPHLINRINVDAVRLDQVDLQNLPKLERYLVWQLQQFKSQQFKSIGSIIFGSNRGQLIAVSHISEQNIILVSDRRDTSKIYVYASDTLGNREKLQEIFRQPDVRERPWYKAAANTRQPKWTEIFQLGDGSDLTINANRPVYDVASNELLGVFSINLELTTISKFLQGLQVGKSGKVFILERNGLLIANSGTETPYIISPKKELKRLKAIDSKNTLIRATSRYLSEHFSNEFSRIENKSEQLNFKINGQRQFVQVMPYRDEFGLDWLIVVVVPEADFMERIDANTRTTVMLSVATLIASLGIGIITARWITKPILSLNAAAKDLAKGEWDKTVEVNRADEVGQLANSFNIMAAQMKQSFGELESLNAALVHSESKLNQILEAMPVGVSVHDPTGQIIYVNQSAKQLLEINETVPEAKTEQLAATYGIYQAETDLLYPAENLPIVRSLRGEQVRLDDLEIRLPKRIFPAEVYSMPLFDEGEEIVGAIAVFVDITERKQAEKLLANYNRTLEAEVTERTAELAQINSHLEQEIRERQQTEIALAAAKETAEAASLAKSTFLANMSHELRTPLNGIMGYAQIIQLDKECTVKQQQGVSIIYKCSEHLLTLINDILSLSKIEANKFELEPEIFNFSEFLQGVSEIFRLKALQKSIDFIYEAVTELPQNICADSKRLRQVLINLLNNAIKFTKSGSVTFTVEVIKGEELLHSQSSIENPKSKIPNQLIRFQIADTGCGIPPEQLEKIFLPFEQVGENSRKIEGTGLGLAITKNLISLMNSKIYVESTLGVSSKFWFDLDLPVSSDLTKSTSVISTDTIIGYQGQKQKILVVDDRWENRSVIIDLLEPLGFEITEAAEGQAGLAKAIELQPDLILSDLVMPGMDGWWLIRELRQLTQFQSTIIIAASASAFNADRQKCLELGYSDFIAKPIQVPELLEKIKNYLNLSWIYAPAETKENLMEAVPLADSQQEMTLPPREELLALYQAAKGFYVEDVDREVSRLKQLQPEYNAFVAKVLQLSDDFEYQAIVKLVEPYL